MSQILRGFSAPGRRAGGRHRLGTFDRRPGFGFGKQRPQNSSCCEGWENCSSWTGRYWLVSGKKTIAHVLGTGDESPLEGTLATTALAIAQGADIVRVHDAEPNVRVARMTDAVVRGHRSLPERG